MSDFVVRSFSEMGSTMVKFFLVLYFAVEKCEAESLTEEELDAIADRSIDKPVEMPVVPRIGERICLGNDPKVDLVKHWIEYQKVEVVCYVRLFDAVAAYCAEPEGWNLDDLPLAGRELFLQKVQEFRDKSST